MSLPLQDDAVRAAHDRLTPYAARAFEEAADFALRLHADEVSIEHLFATLMRDEDSAVAQATLHAFADPQTIAVEIVALCPGITVVGSERCLPFSVRSVTALLEARSSAAGEGAARVEPAHVFSAALRAVEEAPAAALDRAGARPAAGRGPAGAGEDPVRDEGPLFKSFSSAARRALSLAGHEASRLARDAVSPAHLLVGCIEADEGLRAEVGLTAMATRLAVGEDDQDARSPAPREIPPSCELLGFLERSAEGADSLALLSTLLEHGRPELIQVMTRQKVTAALVARCREQVWDPE